MEEYMTCDYAELQNTIPSMDSLTTEILFISKQMLNEDITQEAISEAWTNVRTIDTPIGKFRCKERFCVFVNPSSVSKPVHTTTSPSSLSMHTSTSPRWIVTLLERISALPEHPKQDSTSPSPRRIITLTSYAYNSPSPSPRGIITLTNPAAEANAGEINKGMSVIEQILAVTTGIFSISSCVGFIRCLNKRIRCVEKCLKGKKTRQNNDPLIIENPLYFDLDPASLDSADFLQPANLETNPKSLIFDSHEGYETLPLDGTEETEPSTLGATGWSQLDSPIQKTLDNTKRLINVLKNKVHRPPKIDLPVEWKLDDSVCDDSV